jgi:hypothetical protein
MMFVLFGKGYRMITEREEQQTEHCNMQDLMSLTDDLYRAAE